MSGEKGKNIHVTEMDLFCSRSKEIEDIPETEDTQPDKTLSFPAEMTLSLRSICPWPRRPGGEGLRALCWSELYPWFGVSETGWG